MALKVLVKISVCKYETVKVVNKLRSSYEGNYLCTISNDPTCLDRTCLFEAKDTEGTNINIKFELEFVKAFWYLYPF